MHSDPSVILIEFNELSPSLLAEFMEAGKLPSFQRFHRESHVYVTQAEEGPPNLEPWIQWVTVHSGLPFSEHQVFHLGDGHKLKHKCVWDLLSDAGRRVWVCGSMNVRYDLPVNGYVLPDPWTTDAQPHPEALRPYFDFVRTHVQEHTKGAVPIASHDYLRFAAFMLAHGLSGSTVLAALRQLAVERSGRHRWKRALVLDWLQWDLFHSVFRSLRPHFSTFFSNSTAHFQHMYWRNMAPELFRRQPTADEQAEFASAILRGYQNMDVLLRRFLALAGAHTTLILCTALSQQPCLTYEDQGGKSFYRPTDFERLLDFAGIRAPHTVSPVMSEQFHVYFESVADAAHAEHQLTRLRLGNRPVLRVERNGRDVFTGCQVYEQVAPDSRMTRAETQEGIAFFHLFYQIEGVKSGMHHPDGVLWVRDPDRKHQLHDTKVPLTSIAPTLLARFGLPRPDYMRTSPLST